MSGTTMIVLIVFISVGFGVIYDMYKKHLEFKHKAQQQNTSNAGQFDAMAQEISSLRERIQVLEKIVTDDGFQVKREIDKL